MIVLTRDGCAAQADLDKIGELGTRKHKANFFIRYDFQLEKLKGAVIQEPRLWRLQARLDF